MKWKVVVVLIVKDEADYIEDWLCYHIALGVEHFLIYDNGSTDKTASLLRKFINGGIVTLISWPMKGGQYDAYSHAVRFLSGNVEWIGFLDVDEFVVLHQHNMISEFLLEIDADQVLFPWRNFSYGGHNSRPAGSAPETYFWALRVPADGHTQVKHFVRPASDIRQVTAHCSAIGSDKTRIADGTTHRATHVIQNPSYSGAQINHYATRSFSENQERLRKGQVSGSSHKRLDDFTPLTENLATALDYDDSILKHLSPFKSALQKWSLVADYPHRYGLQQNAPYLKSANNFLFYMTKSIGNYVLSEQTVKPLTDLKFFSVLENGSKIDVTQTVHEGGRRNFRFIFPGRSYLRYFQGTVHYGDFVRRFGFDCLLSCRQIDVRSMWNLEFSPGPKGFAVFAEIESTQTVEIELQGRSSVGVLAAEKTTPGQNGVVLYIPKLADPDFSIQIVIKGICIIREIIVGALPI